MIAHLNAKRKESAVRAELDNAQKRINDITADVHDRIIEEQASNSAQAKWKAASAKKCHRKELNRQQMECDDAINQMQLTMKDNEKKALGVQKRQAAKSLGKLMMPIIRILGVDRQDSSFEGALPIYMGHKFIVQFLHEEMCSGSKENILQTNMFIIIGSTTSITALHHHLLPRSYPEF